MFEEITYTLLSLNFNTLIAEHCKFNKQILVNRLHLWFVHSKCAAAKTVKMLPAIFKILKEEFFKDDIFQLRDIYHEKELKKNIKQIALVHDQGEDPENGEVSLDEAVLLEIEAKKAYLYLEKEFELKYFNERSGVVHRPKKHESEGK